MKYALTLQRRIRNVDKLDPVSLFSRLELPYFYALALHPVDICLQPLDLCTGYMDLYDMDKAKELGFRDVLKKPFLMRYMAEAIRCVLDRSTTQ